jgi:ABC-type glutathione transport system ATPase component
MRMAEAPAQIVLEAIEVSRDFDVSRPWLQRKMAGEPRRTLRAVDNISFAIRRGTTLSLVVESGCGKSTVARLAVGLYAPTNGEIRFEGQPLSAARAQASLRRRMNMIFQDPFASLNPRWRVRDIVAEPLRAFNLLSSPKDIADRVGQLLTQVGLAPARNTRTNSAAASASACRSPAHCRASRNSWSATNPPARWMSRCRRKSSTSCATCSNASASPTCSSATTSRWCATCRTGSE